MSDHRWADDAGDEPQLIPHELRLVVVQLLQTIGSVASPELCSRGPRARGARVPKFVVTKSSRSKAIRCYRSAKLACIRKLQGARAPVPQCPMPGDASGLDPIGQSATTRSVVLESNSTGVGRCGHSRGQLSSVAAGGCLPPPPIRSVLQSGYFSGFRT